MIERMSRAFVKENDQESIDAGPERVVSEHPNLVTAEGLRQIETHLRDLAAARRVATEADDKTALARIARDQRYWSSRHATAKLVPRPSEESKITVRFGCRVTLALADGSERSFKIVGEDEANPAQGSLSWVSPVATSLLGATIGELVAFQGKDAEIVGID